MLYEQYGDDERAQDNAERLAEYHSHEQTECGCDDCSALRAENQQFAWDMNDATRYGDDDQAQYDAERLAELRDEYADDAWDDDDFFGENNG